MLSIDPSMSSSFKKTIAFILFFSHTLVGQGDFLLGGTMTEYETHLPTANFLEAAEAKDDPTILPTPSVQADVPVKSPPQALAPQARLKIPKINVDAVIKEMGITPDGAMAVPGNRVDVGWFRFGTRPGQIGSAVIGGHNRWDGGVAVFHRLDQLKKGDIVSVVDAKGTSTSFVVRDMRTYDANDTQSGIFESVSGAHLNLITCSGTLDPVTQNYATRLVVFTDAI